MEIIARKDAKAQGMTRYYTGKPCKKRGHVAERYVSDGTCAECRKVYHTKRPSTEKDRARKKEQYAERVAVGVCPNCKAPASEGNVYCDRCAKCARENKSKRYYKSVAAGVCPNCKAPASEGKVYCDRCAERTRVYGCERYASDPDFRDRALQASRTQRWAVNNPGKNRAKTARRRACKRDALPQDPEARKELQAVEAVLRDVQEQYRRSGLEAHVDHIIPLSRGGLHVPENLRIVPADDNIRKGNKLDSELDFQIRVLLAA